MNIARRKIINLTVFLCLVLCPGVSAIEKSVGDYFREANADHDKGNFEKAEAAYTKAIELSSSYQILYYSRGQTRLKKGDLDGAIVDLSKALSLSPRNRNAYRARCLLAEVFHRKRDFKKSINQYEIAIAMNPDLDEAYMGRGIVYAAQGEMDDAVLDFNRAMALDPSNDAPYVARAKVFSTQNFYKKAALEYSRAIELNPKSDTAYAGRGTTRFIQNDYQGALSDLQQALVLNPALEEDLALFIEQAKKVLR